MDQLTEDSANAVKTRVDAFVRDRFYLPGTLRLHRNALGWDLLRAPVNVILAPVFLLIALMASLAQLARLPRVAAWLRARHILMKTSVARRIETDIATVLLQDADLTPHSQALISDYTAIRSAVAEITTSLFVLATGLALFGTATPGVVSLAPAVSFFIGDSVAVADFPLGSGLGRLWYGVFPVRLPVWFVVMTGVGLAMVASVITTFAGVVADPVQAHLGIHRRRLLKLLDRIGAAEGQAAGLAPEHILARLGDLTDAGISLVRFFRS